MLDPFQFSERPTSQPGIEAIWSVVGGDLHADYPVLPDGCMDLVLRCRVDVDGRPVEAPELLAGGIQNGSYRVSTAAGTRFIGLRFAPGWGGAWLGASAESLRGHNLPASNLGPQLAKLVDRLGALRNLDAAPAMLLNAFAEPARKDLLPEPRALEALQLLRQSGGRIGVDALAKRLGVSVRTVRREVTAAAGLPPKMLAQIFRFQRALNLNCGENLAGLADETGYADQAHLTRAFRQFGNFTPAGRFEGVLSPPR